MFILCQGGCFQKQVDLMKAGLVRTLATLMRPKVALSNKSGEKTNQSFFSSDIDFRLRTKKTLRYKTRTNRKVFLSIGTNRKKFFVDLKESFCRLEPW